MTGRNDPCWCGSGKKWKKCHYPNRETAEPSAFDKMRNRYYKQHGILIKTPEQIEGIRKSSQLASHILEETSRIVKPGITTQELNDFAHDLHLKHNAIPAPLHYGEPPYPRSICTSLNDVICHGIPDETVLIEGDFLNIDVTCILDGYYGDCSRMVALGEISPEKQLVMDVSYECLMRSIAAMKPGVPISVIGDIIVPYAKERGCSVVNQFVGHGIGIEFHEGPQIPHSHNRIQTLFIPGMTFTIEPMINAGALQGVIDPRDKWTARTIDGKASAQWEHTILITDDGHEILTNWKR